MKNYSQKLARKLFIQNVLLVIENIWGWLNLIDKLIRRASSWVETPWKSLLLHSFQIKARKVMKRDFTSKNMDFVHRKWVTNQACHWKRAPLIMAFVEDLAPYMQAVWAFNRRRDSEFHLIPCIRNTVWPGGILSSPTNLLLRSP